MSDWLERSLAEICVTIRAGGTPAADNPSFYGGDTPFVTIEDITRAGRTIERTTRGLTKAGIDASAAWIVPEDHLLYSMYATLGKVTRNVLPMATNQAILAIKPDLGLIETDILFYLLQISESSILALASQTTQANLNAEKIRKFKVRFPTSLQEQHRIAEILSTLDEAIEQTEALIAKMQQVKAGMMHDLFTRGVTPDGHLRPTREQDPDLYKESPLGWIPKEWEVLIVNELLAKTACPMRSGPFGSALLKDELVEEGIPFLGIDNIFIERFLPKFNRYVSKRKYQELIRYSVFPRDVIITIMGTVGRCCVVPENASPMLSSKHLWSMTFDSGRVLPELICWQLNHASWVKNWFARHSQGAVMEAIQSSTLRNLKLPVPSIEEQKQIYARYVGCSRGIEAEEECLAKLRQQKHGLMHDLLSGSVRVSENNEFLTTGESQQHKAISRT